MPAAKKGRSKNAKSPKKAQEGPLDRSFKAKANAKPAPKALPAKQQTAGFLSYLHSSIKSSNSDLSNMACAIQKRYREMDGPSKRAMIVEFYRHGGKRSGLSSTYYQEVSTKQKSDDVAWAGYVTVGKLLSLHGVPHNHLAKNDPRQDPQPLSAWKRCPRSVPYPKHGSCFSVTSLRG